MSDERVDHTRKGELPRVGETLEGAYRLEDVVASGGMGVIMQATDLKMERDVAVKLLHPHMAEREDTAKRFEREIHLAKVLAHPNIIQLFDYGQTPSNALYIVMEYLEGVDLDALIKREAPLAVDRSIDIALQILDGLAEAHDRSVIHRDLKPSNVFLTERRRGGEHVKLLDFGIAKSLEGAQTAVTSTGQICGTAMYMPPESVFQHSPGKRGDVYAVGLLLLEMLMGERVFDGGTMPQTLMMHVQKPVPIPTDIIDTPLGDCIKRATTKHPDDRYDDADAMLDDLADAAEQMELTREVDPNDITETGSSVGNQVFPSMGDSDVDMDMLREAPSHESADAIPRDAPPDTPAPSSPQQRQTPGESDQTADTDPSAPTVVTPPSRQPPAEGDVSDDSRMKRTEKLPGFESGEGLQEPTEPTDAPAGDSTPSPSTSTPVQQDARGLTTSLADHWQKIAAGAAALAVVGLGAWTISAGGASTDRSAANSAQPKSGSSAAPADQTGGTEPSTASDDGKGSEGSGTGLGLDTFDLESEPSGATVLVEGEPVGETPTEIELPTDVGGVELEFRKSGYDAEILQIEPSEGQRDFDVTLEAEKPEKRASPNESASDDSPDPSPSPTPTSANRRDRETPAADRERRRERARDPEPTPTPDPEPSAETTSTSDPGGSSSSEQGSSDLMQVESIGGGESESGSSDDESDDFESIADDFTVD